MQSTKLGLMEWLTSATSLYYIKKRLTFCNDVVFIVVNGSKTREQFNTIRNRMKSVLSDVPSLQSGAVNISLSTPNTPNTIGHRKNYPPKNVAVKNVVKFIQMDEKFFNQMKKCQRG